MYKKSFQKGGASSPRPQRAFGRSRPPSAFGQARPSSTFGQAPRGGKPFGHGSRPPFRGGRGGSFGKPQRGRSQHIDVSKFINKAVITEEVEHFKPEHVFADFKIEAALKNAVIKKGYDLPTPIQDRAIPHVLRGEDLVGIANTGTGKTAAFLIPLINKVLLKRSEQIMIIVPTRELALQIDQELKGFTAGLPAMNPREKIFSVCCVGGVGITPQIKQLRYQYNFVIGTPGRLKDLIDRKMITLSEFNTIVLDEADRMLDMGFVADMRAIMTAMPKERHTLFFSATLSPDIEKLIKEFLREPIRISVKTRDTSKNVDQDVVRVKAGGDKLDTLHDLLNQKEFSKVLIFGRTKHGVEKLSKMLGERGFKVESIHGNKNHGGRQRALGAFKDNRVQVLVATDVAARGLDIADVSHVINYDIPETYDDYVHRIGRTGRGNKKGKALTFVESR